MKKIFIGLTLVLVLVIATAVSFADGNSVIKVNAELGTLSVNYSTADYTDLKVLVKKGTEQYVYNLFDSQENFALQMGNGQYTIGIYQRTSGNKYRKITSITSNVNVDPMKVFTASVQNINWSEDSPAILLAKELTADAITDQEKFDAIYNFVIHNVVYDYKKAATVGSRYIPINELTVDSGKGICYDYSSLVASMLRSVGVPSKLVEGQSTYTSVYHAWNQIYVDEKWVTVDTTVDAQLAPRGIAYSIEKLDKDYSVVKAF